MSPKNGAKKMKGNASETVTEAKNVMNKKAPPGDVNNSNMCNNTVNNDTAFEIQLDDDTTLKSSRTKKEQFLPIMLWRIIPLLCLLAFMDRNVLKVNRNWILIALCV